MRASRVLIAISQTLAIGACSAPPAPTHVAPVATSSATAVPVASDPPDGPMPTLRAGNRPPIDAGALECAALASFVSDGMETISMKVHVDPKDADGTLESRLSVSVAGSSAYSFVPNGPSEAGWFHVWIRRPASAKETPISADLFLTKYDDSPGRHYHLNAPDPGSLKHDASLVADWERALAKDLGRSSGAWQMYAQTRLNELAPVKPDAPPKASKKSGGHPAPVRPQPVQPTRPNDELAVLMDTSTGTLAVQEALQSDRRLLIAAEQEKRTVQIASVTAPKLAEHPWKAMLQKLSVKPPTEALATSAPAEFYYVRAASFDALLKTLDQVDTWGTPASHALKRELSDHNLAARYEAELGLSRGPLTRALGPSVVSEIAVVGSDPYVNEGTDVTIILRVKDHSLFNASLSADLATLGSAHGAITQSKTNVSGVDVSLASSADGTVRQERATIGDLEFVSNSPQAIKRVIEATQGKRPRLSDEPDFQFMLARDASTRADVLAYAGDRFVGEVIGPRQKIGEARRQLALSELLTPGFSSLLFGFMFGKSPASVDDLVHAHLLAKADLKHQNGDAISWSPGETARSSWGTPAELLPLIDALVLDVVTPAESASYQRFARGYENDWQTYLDPIALRLAIDEKGDHTDITADLRELPLIDGSDYNKIESQAGDARFVAGPLSEGARAIIGIGQRSELRSLASEASRGLLGRHDIQLDWIGDWGAIGVLDRPAAADAALTVMKDEIVQMPAPDSETRDSDAKLRALSHAPLYAELAIKNPLGATVALTAIRAMVGESAPGLVDWGEIGQYRDVPIVRVSVDPKKAHDEFETDLDAHVYYSLTHGALMATLSEPTLRHLIDDRLDGKAPTSVSADGLKKDASIGTQFAVEVASGKDRAVSTVLGWVLESAISKHGNDESSTTAEALFRGAPDHANDPAAMRRLAFAYFGATPLAMDGGAYTLSPEGLRDPVRGNAYSPVWPALPVAGSPMAALMRALAHARAELSFDAEGSNTQGKKMRSLHARVTTRIDN